MNHLIRRKPFGEMGDVFDSMERTFESMFRDMPRAMSQISLLPLDIYEKDDAFYVRASVPGLREEDLDLTVDKDVITLRGTIRNEWESESTKLYRREATYGSFNRSIRLPEGVDVEAIEATFDRGILTIQIPKSAKATPEPRRIPLRTSEPNPGPAALENNASEAQNVGNQNTAPDL